MRYYFKDYYLHNKNVHGDVGYDFRLNEKVLQGISTFLNNKISTFELKQEKFVFISIVKFRSDHFYAVFYLPKDFFTRLYHLKRFFTYIIQF